jgi:ribosomal protein L37AE/L43A
VSNLICPCCSSTLLRHIRHAGVYWYCSRCHEEMPDLSPNPREKEKEKESAPLSSVQESPNFKFNSIGWSHQKNLLKVANSA